MRSRTRMAVIAMGAVALALARGGAAGRSAKTAPDRATGLAARGAGRLDLCAGMIKDKDPHPMTRLDKPPVGGAVTDAEFKTTIRRISAVSGSGAHAAIVPMYTTVSAWNADESLLILYDVSSERHVLYDGRTYQRIRPLEIHPADLEQVYWDTADPDVLYYFEGRIFIRYHVKSGKQDQLHDFKSQCGEFSLTNGEDPMFTSWDSHRIGLRCARRMFIYDRVTDTIFGEQEMRGVPPAQVAPSGKLAYLEAGSGEVLDENLHLLRSLSFQQPAEHASLGRLANGHDTWNGAIYDDGNDDAKSNVGTLVTRDLTTGAGDVIIGPKTGYPYPPDGHVSAMAYRQPGWIFVSTYGHTSGQGLLDLENLIADTNTGAVCRIGRHRSWGKSNKRLGYWAEAHTVPSPSGTRALFASDWGNGSSVDSYVLEMPSYAAHGSP